MGDVEGHGHLHSGFDNAGSEMGTHDLHSGNSEAISLQVKCGLQPHTGALPQKTGMCGCPRFCFCFYLSVTFFLILLLISLTLVDPTVSYPFRL